MKQAIRTGAAILAAIAAAVLLLYIVKLIGCVMIHLSDTFGIPL